MVRIACFWSHSRNCTKYEKGLLQAARNEIPKEPMFELYLTVFLTKLPKAWNDPLRHQPMETGEFKNLKKFMQIFIFISFFCKHFRFQDLQKKPFYVKM